MNKKISAVTFVRKELNVRGKSEHNGRGGYMCWCKDVKDLFERVKKKVKEWEEKGLLKEVVLKGDRLQVIFKLGLFKDDWYRGFEFVEKNENLYFCFMTFIESLVEEK